MGRIQPTADGGYLRTLLGKDFTDEQMAVITAPLAPQLVVAGAGSGKTMVMAARVVHAVAHFGISADRILGVTFTNKAAAELAERVRLCLAALPPRGEDEDHEDLPTVATYNSYAAQIVRDHALRIGREPGATLLTEAVQWQLAMRVASRAPGPFPHLDWTTPYVAELVVALAGEVSDHLCTHDAVRAHDARVRAAVDELAKPLKWAKDMVAKTLARDELLTLVSLYNEEKARLDLIDFGDQVALACAIAETSAEVAAIERDRYQVVVLDEYQDTGVAQRVLFSTLFGDSHAITAVGDPNQAIYGWRGASASNLSRFAEHFDPRADPAVPMPLMTSFRCDGRILEAANVVAKPLHDSLVRKARSRLVLPELRAVGGREDAGEVAIARLATAHDEADWLAQRIVNAMTSGVPAGQIAVLGRRRTDFPRLHQAMVLRDIPVEVVGLGGLLAMPEVSDIVATLTLLADGTANASAVRLLTGPRWRIGVRDMAAIGRRAGHLARLRVVAEPGSDDEAAGAEVGEAPADEPEVGQGLNEVLAQATSSADPVEAPSLLEAIESPGPPAAYSPEAYERIARFVVEIRRLRRLVGQPLVDLVTEVIAASGLDVEVEAGDAALAAARIANIHAFLDVTAQFNGIDGEADLVAFLAYLKAAAENERGLDLGAVSDTDTVKLMTIHAAKGLEWDVVAVPCLVDQVFPTGKSRSSWVTGAAVLPFACRGDSEDLPTLHAYEKTADFDAFKDECRSDSNDEERRLAYVAFTRARHQLWLSAYTWIGTRKDPCATSPFLAEVAEIGEPTITVDEWCEMPEADIPNPILAAGVVDVAWPVVPDPAETARRKAAAALVEAARGALRPMAEVTGDDAAIAADWRRDTALLIDEAHRRRSRTIDVAVPPRLTTSQVVALARDEDAFAAALARPVPVRPQPQARRGSRFHQWVEGLYNLAGAALLDPDDLPGAGDEALSDAELADLQEKFLASGWAQRVPVKVEAPFEMVVGGRLLRGRIDAVYATGDGGYDVIDFKTGAMPKGADFEAAALQLSIYRLAWADLAGVDPSGVTAGFLYVRDSHVERPAKLLDRDELAVLLGGVPEGAQPSA
ncbi:MAG TPA: ATP-dependent DNA helicase [Mycobacteriales bacterium]|nr:ATP-dependent DNA helicase [Mycobacteriales bacterium]